MKTSISCLLKGFYIISGLAVIIILFQILNQFYFEKPITPTLRISMGLICIIWCLIYLSIRIIAKIYCKQDRKREGDFVSLLRRTCDNIEMINEDDQLEDLWLIYEPNERNELIDILKKKTKGKRILKEAIIELNQQTYKKDSLTN